MSKYKITVYNRSDIEFYGYMDVKATDINHASDKVKALGLDIASIQKYVEVVINYDHFYQGIGAYNKRFTLFALFGKVDQMVYEWKSSLDGTVIINSIKIEGE